MTGIRKNIGWVVGGVFLVYSVYGGCGKINERVVNMNAIYKEREEGCLSDTVVPSFWGLWLWKNNEGMMHNKDKL